MKGASGPSCPAPVPVWPLVATWEFFLQHLAWLRIDEVQPQDGQDIVTLTLCRKAQRPLLVRGMRCCMGTSI